MSVIEVKQLTKVFKIPKKEPGLGGAVKGLFHPQYQNKTAVNEINFKLEAGEIVGYIGVNGAGKSTTIKMLTGVLMPTSGSINVLGRDPHKQRVDNAHDIGVVFGQRTQLWWDLALIESLNLIARIYDVHPVRYKSMLDQFTQTLELDELLNIPVRNMSLGQKMRSELAAALIHEPRVVYLDEPTIGLDLIVKERIRDFIKAECISKGMTVILTTHDLGDIEELCQRVIIIDDGRIIYDGPIETIKKKFGKFREITFETVEEVKKLDLPAGAEMLSTDDHKVQIRFDRTVSTASKVAGAVMNQIDVRDFSLSEPELSDIVKQIYNGALDREGAMIQTARRNLSVYSAILAMIPKQFMAYQLWFWIGLVLSVISMAILVYFWRAIYANTSTISGLAQNQTINYILLAFIFMPLTSNDLIWEFGSNLREGTIIHHLLRPINFQGMNYAQMLGGLVTHLILQIPMAVVAVLIFGLRFPTDLSTWLAFSLSALLGFTVMFFFNWFLACFTFYTTEIWGLGVLVDGMTFFLSGALVPLVMMPDWIRNIVLSIPFAQALAVPVGLLTGITPLTDAPRVWFIQILWILGMWIISTLFFRVAVRKVTVQGG